MNRVCSLMICGLVVWPAAPALADPALLNRGYILRPFQAAFWARFMSFEFNKRSDAAGTITPLAAGESRRITALPWHVSVAIPSGVEFSVEGVLYDVSHRLTSGASTTLLSRNGMGDLTFFGRNLAVISGDLKGALGIGVRIPTGLSIYQAGKNELPTGDGSWGALASFAWTDQRYGKILFNAEVTYQLSFPFTTGSVNGQPLPANEVRVGFGHTVTGGAGIEMALTDGLTLLADFTGVWRQERTVTYVQSAADAMADVATQAFPEYPLVFVRRVDVTPSVQIRATPSLLLSIGWQYPLYVVNGYSGEPNSQLVASATLKFP